MELSIGLIWLGAFLVIVGVLFTAAKALGRGRLSGGRSANVTNTLEPPGRSARLRLAANWPGLAFIAAGTLLLLAGAST